MNDPAPDHGEREVRPTDPIAPQDVASAARSCVVILLVGVALIIVIGLYLILGWVS